MRSAIVCDHMETSLYNIASSAAQSNSVYLSVLKILIVIADGLSTWLLQIFFIRASGHCYGREKYYIRENNG